MSLRFYMDQHIQSAITRGLRQRGIDCLTTQEDQTEEWDDERLLQRATSLGRVFVSEDVDLLVITHNWSQHSQHFPGLVFVKHLDINIGQAIRDLQLIGEVYQPDEMTDRVEFLPL